MASCKSVYDPREDSTMLERHVREHAKGLVLDIGTGSGIQAITAAGLGKVKKVIALDIQKGVIEHCKKNIKNRKISFYVSDLFSIFKKAPINKKTNKNELLKNKKNIKFDTIVFNPPYLPNELKIKDLTIEGGRKGYEAVERFFDDVNDFLKSDGIILIVFSSLTKKEKVDEFIEKNLLESELLEKQHYFFEELYVYLIKKNTILKKLEKKGIENIKYFSKGKRGLIYTGLYNNKKIIIKIKNPKSKAIARIENEIKHLKLLNKKNIGPKLLFFDKDFLVYEFVDGSFIVDYLKNNKKENIKKTIKNIFTQLHIMDKLKINKEEMSHPMKHIIIDKKTKKPVLIDFERCRKTIKPSNVTQFCDFLISNNVLQILKGRNFLIDKKKIIGTSKNYKNNLNQKDLNKIVSLLG